MAVDAKLGEIYRDRTGLNTVKVVGFWRKYGYSGPDVYGNNGVLLKATGVIQSGGYALAVSLADWAAQGFVLVPAKRARPRRGSPASVSSLLEG